MSTTSPKQINMGYGGYCGIDWRTDSLLLMPKTTATTAPTDMSTIESVFITSGNIGVQYNRPVENTYRSPRTTTNTVPILLGVGTAQISGSVSFDMSHLNLDYFLSEDKLKRNTYFHLLMTDGGNYYGVYQNVWNSFSISGASGGIVTCSIGYMSLNCCNPDIYSPSANIASISNSFDNALVAYWQAGVQGYIESFTINLTQDVTPVYLNNDNIMPSYLRCGAQKLNANIQSCIGWQDIGKILDLTTYPGTDTDSGKFAFKIGKKTFTLNNTILSTKQYTHNGGGDVVKYSYSVQSVGLTSPNDKLFSIT